MGEGGLEFLPGMPGNFYTIHVGLFLWFNHDGGRSMTRDVHMRDQRVLLLHKVWAIAQYDT